MTNDQIACRAEQLQRQIAAARSELQMLRASCPHKQVKTLRRKHDFDGDILDIPWAICLICGLEEENVPGSPLYQDRKGERTMPAGGRKR